MRDLYTDDEIICCTYAALYDADDFGGVEAICRLTNRPLSSIKMKVRNFAAMLAHKGIPVLSKVSNLTGTTTGQTPRSTNWDVVEPLTLQTRENLLKRCLSILTR